MEFTIKHRQETVFLGSLSPGDILLHDNQVFLRGHPASDYSVHITALNDGNQYIFHSSLKVTPLEPAQPLVLKLRRM